MATTGVRVTGLNQVVRSLQKAGVEVADLKAAFATISGLVVRRARPLTPVLTGRLVGSIRGSRAKSKAVIRAGGARVPYAGVQHFGGYHGIEPHPFLTDALEDTRPEVIHELERGLNSLIRKHDLN